MVIAVSLVRLPMLPQYSLEKPAQLKWNPRPKNAYGFTHICRGSLWVTGLALILRDSYLEALAP